MKKNKFIAYEGDNFTIEWYFDKNDKSAALEYYNELPSGQQSKLKNLFFIFANTGKIRNEEKFRYEGDQIYAFKPTPDRFLCFFYQGGKVIVTNAYEKKTDRMPVREKDRALKAKADYIKRCKEENYYD
jgi:phage-related protein